MSFRLVPKSVTLNDLEQRKAFILRYFTEFGSFRGALHKSGWLSHNYEQFKLVLYTVHHRLTVFEWRLWFVPASFCRRHSDLRLLLTNFVLVFGTAEPHLRIDAAASRTRSNRLHLNITKTEIIWLPTGRRLRQLPTQSLRVGSDLVMPVSVVRDLGIDIDLDVWLRSHTIKTTSACFAVLRQIWSIRQSVSTTVLQSLVSCLVLSRLCCNSVLAGIPLHHTAHAVSLTCYMARLFFFEVWPWRHPCYSAIALATLTENSMADRLQVGGTRLQMSSRLSSVYSYLADELHLPADSEFRKRLRWPSFSSLRSLHMEHSATACRHWTVSFCLLLSVEDTF